MSESPADDGNHEALHRAAAESFNHIAELYDRARPSYPSQLYYDVSALLDIRPEASVLDIGCGTGKSTALFARHGHPVLALDPGSELLAVCRRNLQGFARIRYVQSSFEAWEPGEEVFDVVISGTAFHWVDESKRTAAIRLLSVRGAFVVFWNTYLHGTDEVFRVIDRVYDRFAPELHVDDVRASQEMKDARTEQQLTWAPGLANTRVLRYYSRKRYSADEYADLHRSFSSNRNRSNEFFAAIAAAVSESGGSLLAPYRTTCVVGRALG